MCFALGGEQLGQVAEAKQFLHPGRQVYQFQPAVPFFGCRDLEPYQGSQAGAIEVAQVAEVKNDATAQWNEGLNQFLDLTGVFAH